MYTNPTTTTTTFEKMSLTNEPVECPICFDCIGEKNNITTECGHKFHASCLMTNVSRNGFGCPCCRAAMAETPEEDDWDFGYTDDDDETATLLDVPEEPFSDDALRGLRLLTNLLEGNEQDQADVVAEHQYVSGEEEEHVTGPAPPRQDIVRMLREQDVTYEQLVAFMLMDHEEYEEQTDELERFAGDLWGRMRMMISNYMPEAPAPEVLEEVVPPEADLSSIYADDEEYDIEFEDLGGFSFVEDRSHLYKDLDEIRMDLAQFMVDYAAQPKTSICV
jgi:hypothetical protein